MQNRNKVTEKFKTKIINVYIKWLMDKKATVIANICLSTGDTRILPICKIYLQDKFLTCNIGKHLWWTHFYNLLTIFAFL